jgi:hypothetical protein
VVPCCLNGQAAQSLRLAMYLIVVPSWTVPDNRSWSSVRFDAHLQRMYAPRDAVPRVTNAPAMLRPPLCRLTPRLLTYRGGIDLWPPGSTLSSDIEARPQVPSRTRGRPRSAGRRDANAAVQQTDDACLGEPTSGPLRVRGRPLPELPELVALMQQNVSASRPGRPRYLPKPHG